MTAIDLITKFTFHDSLITGVDAINNGSIIKMQIDFAFWMQPGYKDTDPETGLILLTFSNVSKSQIPSTKWEETSILDVIARDEYVVFSLINEFTDESLEIKIQSNDIEISIL